MKKETTTGFKQETPIANNTPGGDPCVRRPENQSTTPATSNDDTSGFVVTNPMGDFDPTSYSGDFTSQRGGG